MSRVQVDLIDLRTRPDGDYKYIAHARDHFTRFSWAIPLKNKEAIYVASFLFQIFTQFGPPVFLQSDNGKEFVASIVRDLIQLWPGTRIINGRPRHPRSQGLVEKGNDILENKLSAWFKANNCEDWSMGLPVPHITPLTI